MNKNICVVFVCNNIQYFNKFIKTCNQLVDKGKYNGDICLIVNNDFDNNLIKDSEFILKNKIIIKKFNKIIIPKIKYTVANFKNKVDGCILKFNLFQIYFKNWKYVLYLDCGLNILSDITPILEEVQEDTLLAHSDSYPIFKNKLKNQFISTEELKKKNIKYKNEINVCVDNLNNEFNLNIDYFQSTFMLFDTNIIKNDTFSNLILLLNKFPIGKSNDQCYLSLYFIVIYPKWKQLKIRNEYTNFYDYKKRKIKFNPNKLPYLIVKIKK